MLGANPHQEVPTSLRQESGGEVAQVISCGIKVLKSRVLLLLFVWLFDTLFFAYIKNHIFLTKTFCLIKCSSILERVIPIKVVLKHVYPVVLSCP